MTEPKKKKRSFPTQVDSQVAGLRLVRQQRPAPASGETKPQTLAGANSAGEIHSPEPELVSKLIDFIKSI
jgi:hypothetical protein